MNQVIKFPIMDMTEFVFQAEKVFFSDTEWKTKYTMKGKRVKRIPEWKYIDSEGKILKVKIANWEKTKSLLSFLIQPSYKLELHLENTGEIFPLDELKKEILLKKDEMFHIHYNKMMTLSEYETKLKNATSYIEVIDIASFEDYKD